MAVLKTILLVAFVIVCILTILLVLIQNEDTNGMGSAFGGGQSAAFGAKSAGVLTKTTGVLAGLFFVIALGLSVMNKKPGKADMSETINRVTESAADEKASGNDWLKDELSAPASEATIKAAENQ